MKTTQDINKKVDKLLKSTSHSRRLAKRGLLIIGTLFVSAILVGASVISYVMRSNHTFNVDGKDKWIKINGNSIPYDENIETTIDAGDTGVITYNVSNAWVHDITIYCDLELCTLNRFFYLIWVQNLIFGCRIVNYLY